MPWLIKGVLLAAKSRLGRELLFAGALGAVEVARSARARRLAAATWKLAADPRPRRAATGLARRVAARVKP